MTSSQRQQGKSPRFETAASPSLVNSSPLASSARAFANQHSGSAPSSPFKAQLAAFPALGALHEADDFDSSLRPQQTGGQYNADDLADFFGSSSIKSGAWLDSALLALADVTFHVEVVTARLEGSNTSQTTFQAGSICQSIS